MNEPITQISANKEELTTHNDIELITRVYSSGDELPEGLLTENYFHSPELFRVSRLTPRHRPYMAVVTTTDGTTVGQLLAMVRYRSAYFPPYFYMHCRIYGEGAYAEENETCTEHYGKGHEELFSMMLGEITHRLGNRILYIEVSDLSNKMFAYRQFRQANYFPVRWMSIHNSLHSHAPEERISDQLQQRIDDAYLKGVSTCEVETEEDFQAFSRLLHHHHWLKPRRYMPDKEFFREMQGEHCRLFVTKYYGHIIGCAAVVFSQQQAYLWYSAFRRKSYARLSPAAVTIWHAIKYAYHHEYQHIFFMDVGLPFRRNRYRDFILRFGGKPVSTYRWFHCSVRWINRFLSWFYRD